MDTTTRQVVECLWAALVAVLALWLVTQPWSASYNTMGAEACKTVLHSASRSTFDLLCRPQYQSSNLKSTLQQCPLTHLVEESWPSAVWMIALCLVCISLVHIRSSSPHILRTPVRTALIVGWAVAASLLLQRLILVLDYAYRGTACFTLRSASMDFSCTDDSVKELMTLVRGVVPDVLDPKHVTMLPMSSSSSSLAFVVMRWFEYVGLSAGALLLLVPEHLVRGYMRSCVRRLLSKMMLLLVGMVAGLALVLWAMWSTPVDTLPMQELLTAERVGCWALVLLLLILFVRAIWHHIFHILFYILAPGYIVSGVLLSYKVLGHLVHETCGGAIPVALTLSVVLFYTHRWDCAKAVGAYLVWKLLPTMMTIDWTTLDVLLVIYLIGYALGKLSSLAFMKQQHVVEDRPPSKELHQRHDARRAKQE